MESAKTPVVEVARELQEPLEDLARALDRPTALAVLDATLYARSCTVQELATEVMQQATLPGIVQARELVRDRWPQVRLVAAAHLERETLSKREVRELLAG